MIKRFPKQKILDLNAVFEYLKFLNKRDLWSDQFPISIIFFSFIRRQIAFPRSKENCTFWRQSVFFFIRNKINVGKDDFYGIGSSGEDRLLFIEIAHKRIPHIADFFRVLAIERICCKRVLEMLIFKIQRASLLFSSLLESSAVIVSLSVSVFQVCMARSPFSKINKFSSNYSFLPYDADSRLSVRH